MPNPPPERQGLYAAAIHWSRLSPTGRAILREIGLRLEAGFNEAEIAQMLNAARPEVEALPLPPRVTRRWVTQRLDELREEIQGATAG